MDKELEELEEYEKRKSEREKEEIERFIQKQKCVICGLSGCISCKK